MKNIWKTIVSVCASAVLVFSILFSVGIIAKNNDLKYSIKNNNTNTQIGSVSGGGIEVDQSSPYSKVYYATATTDTGIENAEDGTKGGAIYLQDLSDEEIASGKTINMTMKGSEISGFNAVYGGGIYVGRGATLTLIDGCIKNNTATYGGAVYVADGGKFIMDGGTITNNTTKKYGCIFVEVGGTIELNGGVVIEENALGLNGYIISEDTIDGFHYMEFGSYPQIYVGDTMNNALETWYQNNTPTKINTYHATSGYYWDAYTYMYGDIYARGFCFPYNDVVDYTYKDGSVVKEQGEVVWCKVEPIVWLVTNYDLVISDQVDTINVLSYIGLTAGVYFNIYGSYSNSWENSHIYTWLNTNFIRSAFNTNEQNKIAMTTVYNNTTGGQWNTEYEAEPDGKEVPPTSQKIYLLSYDETKALMPTKAERLCSPSDYALSNYAYVKVGVATSYRPDNGCSASWWLRSSAEQDHLSCRVHEGGTMSSTSVNSDRDSIRPAMKLMLL